MGILASNEQHQKAISEFSCVSVSKRVKVRNLSHENDFDLHENESAGEIYLWLQQNWYHLTPFQCFILIESYLKETPVLA